MKKIDLGQTITILANLGVLLGLVFVGLQIRQSTQELRSEGARSITESVNATNAAIYSDPGLTELIMKGEQDLASLDPVERERFDKWQFSRLNIAEYVLDLEREGVTDLNFRYLEVTVRDFNQKPGLRAFIREYEESYVGSRELLSRLLGGDLQQD